MLPTAPLPRRHLLRLGLAAGATLALAGCSLAEPAPADHFYRLTVEPPVGPGGGAVAEGTVLVENVQVSGVLNQRALLWTTSGTELQQYAYHFWSEAPARALQDAMVRALRTSGAFGEVVTPGYRQRPEWIVRGQVDRLELIGPSGSDAGVQSARVGMTLTVTDGYGETIVLNRAYQETVPVDDGTVAAGARALNRGVETIYGRFLADLRAASFPPPGDRPLGRPRR
ncbi:ABC-type transport auxiliary lipoprotein family protein [Caenispirillum bisanense]|uniref:ABC-type uncharacterized transport system, auxiliary component n=1 Tax=Caenispirillum bisanense TaxID=414052 RepID=A0A286G8N2_9PROT|nr:ABC-type transport auxiliary lipoprotein family protein [Caenispirillum bisanense]SOD91822.1 ABC-type uncharacterized transport system, auxiliary component [Caenispirillum bisanense]